MRNTYMEVLQMRKEAGVLGTAGKKIAPNLAKELETIARLFGATGRGVLKKQYAKPLLRAAGKDAVRPGAKLLKFLWEAGPRKWYYPMDPTEGRRVIKPLRIALTGGAGAGGLYAWLKPEKAKEKLNDAATAVGNGMKDLGNKALDALNAPDQYQIAGTDFSWGRLGNTLNPVSGITGGVDWVPKGYVDFVSKFFPKDKQNAAGVVAHGTFKAGAVGLLAAGLVGGYRAAKHLKDIGSIDKADRPGKDMASQLSTTFEGNLSGEEEQKKAASVKTAEETAIMSPGTLSAQNLTATALPLGVLLLSAGLTYKGVDSAFDKLRNKRLDSAIAEKDQAVKKLITARAQLAKGEANMEAANAATANLDDSDVYTKAASQEKKAEVPIVRDAVQLFGATTAAVILASAIGSYAYTAASDENNLKYKAYKKALKEYAKAKSGITPITVAPKDAPEYFAAIDNAGKKQAPTARELPSYDADSLNRPISISI